MRWSSLVRPTHCGKVRQVIRQIFKPDHVSIDGLKVFIGGEGISPQMRTLVYAERYEGDERRVLAATLKPDDRLLIVGGGIGVTTLHASRIIGDDDAILVYEPNPEIIPVLRQNMAANGRRIRIVDRALAASPGQVDFYIGGNFWSASMLQTGPASRKIAVEADAFDAVVQEFQPSYVLMDAEGAEASLLQSSRLESVRLACVEVHPHYSGEEALTRAVLAMYERGFVIEFKHTVRRTVLFKRFECTWEMTRIAQSG